MVRKGDAMVVEDSRVWVIVVALFGCVEGEVVSVHMLEILESIAENSPCDFEISQQ